MSKNFDKSNLSGSKINKIFDAIYESDIEYLNSLDPLSIDPNIVNEFGDLAVHCAVNKRDIEVLKCLIRLQGAKIVNLKDITGVSPLHIAVYDNQANMVAFLINNDADVEVIDSFEDTPLLRALKYLLIFNNDITNNSFSEMSIGVNETQEERRKIVKFLLCHTLRENIHSNHLDLIVQSENLDLLEYTLKLGINPEDQNYAFNQAIIMKNLRAINIFLMYGVYIDDNIYNCRQLNEMPEIKKIIEMAGRVDLICNSYNVDNNLFKNVYDNQDLKDACILLDELDEDRMLILSSRILSKLFNNKNLSIKQLQISVTNFISEITDISNMFDSNLSLLNTKLIELQNHIINSCNTSADLIPSLFHITINTLKKHNVWQKIITTKNEYNLSIIPEEIIAKRESSEESEQKIKEFCQTNQIKLIEKVLSEVDYLGNNVDIND